MCIIQGRQPLHFCDSKFKPIIVYMGINIFVFVFFHLPVYYIYMMNYIARILSIVINIVMVLQLIEDRNNVYL